MSLPASFAQSRSGVSQLRRPLRTGLVLASLASAGAERQTVSLARGLDRSRFEPVLIPLRLMSSAGAALHDLADVPVWSPEMRRGLDFSAVRRLAAYLRESNFNVLICANQFATLQSLLATRIAGIRLPIWSVFHSSPGHIGTGVEPNLRFSLYWHALRRCAGVVFVSELQRMEWAALGRVPPCTAAVINNGIDLSPFVAADGKSLREQLGWAANDYVVGVCAHLRPEKRIQDLVAAVRILVDRALPMRLLIVGDGPCRAEIELQCQQQLGPNRWAMVGMQRDVAPFLQACSAVALVSAVEAFSIGILEAMASGKPLVVTDVGGAREQIEHGVHGYLVPVAHPARIAESLERLWRERRLEVFGAAARERVSSRFSIDSMVRNYTELLLGHDGEVQVKMSVAA